MLSESEINHIWCPEHRQMEHVYSFDREIFLSNRPNKAERDLAQRLREGKEK
jgi:hypothetical protein